MSLPYQLVALDVDGTLLDSRHRLAPETVQAIREAQARGARICLATGKLLVSARDLVERLGLHGPQVTCNGAAIMDARTGDLIMAWPLTAELAQRAIVAYRDLAPDFPIAWYTADAIYTDATYGSLDTILAAYHEPPLRHVNAFDGELAPAMKLLVAGDPARLADLHERMARRLGAAATVMRTTADFVEVVLPSVNKGVALTEVARELGIARERIAALGDGENDIALLDAAGLGIAMENAMPALLPHAQAITASADELGVVHALNTLGLTSLGEPGRLRWQR
jgi:Cof subfamily protein (haloacid dehalogenase superfamily)